MWRFGVRYSKGRTDIEHLGPNTKIVWNKAQPPLSSKLHDFCTLMHLEPLEDGAFMLLTRATDHPEVTVAGERGSGIVTGTVNAWLRAEMLGTLDSRVRRRGTAAELSLPVSKGLLHWFSVLVVSAYIWTWQVENIRGLL